MAQSAGDLEITMRMGMARLQQDVTQAKEIVGRGMADISSAIAKVQTAAAALGLGVGIGALGAIAKGAIDAADHLNDLSKSTSLTVETLAGLRLAAKQTGSDLDGTAAAMNKLSVNMGKNAEKFAALGVTARDPLEAFKQLADAFVGIQDPQLRAAVAAEALGKSWASAAPLLAEGGKNIGEMVKKGAELSGMTGELARQADEFNDKLAVLAGNGGGVNAVLTQMLPLLNATADGLLEGGKSTTVWSAAGTALTEILRVLVVLAGNVLFVLKGIGAEAVGIATQLVALAHGDLKGFVEIGKQMKADAVANRTAFDAWEKSIMGVGAVTRATTSALDSMDQVQRRMAQDNDARGRAFIEAEERKRRAAREAEEAARAAERARKLAWEDELQDLKEQLGVLKDAYRDMAKLEELMAKRAEVILHDVTSAAVDAAGEMVTAGMAVHDQWSQMWDQVGDATATFFGNLVTQGRSAFSSLKKWLQDLLAQMISIFATRWVLQLGAAAVGATGAGNALASTASTFGANTLAGAAGSYIGGAGTMIGGAYGAAEGFAMGWGSGVAGAGAGVAETAGAWMAGLGSTGWGLIIVAAVAVVAAFFAGRGGGQKVEGSSVGSFDFSGNDTGAYRVSDEYGNRFLRGTQMDSALDPLRDATGAGYRNLVARLGGTFGTAGFGFGASNDPEGDARSRVFGNAMVNGRTVFSGATDVDDKEVDAMLALTSKRAILAALQATDFHDEIDKIFAGAGDVAKLTGEQIDALIAQAREMYAVIEGIQGLGLTGLDVEALRAYATEGETIGQTFQRVAGAWMELQNAFTSADTHIANASARLLELEETLNAAGIQMPITREGWLDVMRSLDQGDEGARALFTTMMNLSGAFDAVRDAADATQDRLDELHRLLGRATDISQAVSRFQSGNAWSRGMTADELVAALRTITDADYASYAPIYQTLINRIVELSRGVQGLNTTVTNIGITSGPDDPSLTPEMRAWLLANQAAQQGAGARGNLRSWLDQTMLGNLSPLNPTDKLDEARSQYEKILALAKGGDTGAIGSLGASADTYLRIAREIFASSSAYNVIYRDVMQQAGGVAGVTEAEINNRLAGVLPKTGSLASSEDLRAATAVLNRILERLDNGVQVSDPETQGAVTELAASVRGGGTGILSAPRR